MNNWKYYKPEIMGIFIATALLNVWYLASFAIENRIIPTTYDYITNAIIVISAAFFGSYSAFHLNNLKEQKRQDQIKVGIINSTLFRLMRQYNLLEMEKIDLEKFRENEKRFFLLPATVSAVDNDMKYEISNLEFLLTSSDKNLLFDLAIEQDRFNTSLLAINQRNDFLLKEVQPPIKKTSFVSFDQFTLETFNETVGKVISNVLINYTDSVYYHIYKNCDSIIKIKERLLKSSKELYPHEKFWNFEKKPEYLA